MPPALPGKLHHARLMFLIASMLALAGAALWLRQAGPHAMPFGCVFHNLTGLHCSGCGMTRAAYAALNGDIPRAFQLNPLGVVLLPLAGIGLMAEAVAWTTGKPSRWQWRPGAKVSLWLVGLVIAFGVLRNLPWWPFSLLAPH